VLDYFVVVLDFFVIVLEQFRKIKFFLT